MVFTNVSASITSDFMQKELKPSIFYIEIKTVDILLILPKTDLI